VTEPTLRFALVEPDGPGLAYASNGAVAFDLAVRETVTVLPRELARLPTNVILEVPIGYALVISLRSSTPQRYGLLMPHGVGIIDRDFHGGRDEILLQVLNFRDEPVTIERGTRIAQGTLVRCDRLALLPTLQPLESRGGFGSTG
jgi:dUTP pyrophosphatase